MPAITNTILSTNIAHTVNTFTNKNNYMYQNLFYLTASVTSIISCIAILILVSKNYSDRVYRRRRRNRDAIEAVEDLKDWSIKQFEALEEKQSKNNKAVLFVKNAKELHFCNTGKTLMLLNGKSLYPGADFSFSGNEGESITDEIKIEFTAIEYSQD